MKKTKKKEIVWQGFAGHFIGAKKCLFRLCSAVNSGKYVVSTVGAYQQKDNVVLEDIGLGRKFETMVFRAKKCWCGCGEWVQRDAKNIDMLPANSPKGAKANHMKLCKKWNNIKSGK